MSCSVSCKQVVCHDHSDTQRLLDGYRQLFRAPEIKRIIQRPKICILIMII